jgi:hypothetical protein
VRECVSSVQGQPRNRWPQCGEVSLDRIRDEDAAGRQILDICAYLAPQPIPLELGDSCGATVRVKPCGTEGGLCVARTVELALVSVMWRGCVVRDTRAHFPRPAESPNANDNVANAVANRSTSDGGKGDRRVRHDRACLINRLTTTDHLLRTNGCAEAKYSRCSAAPIGDGRDS